jgi:hypothetical protein
MIANAIAGIVAGATLPLTYSQTVLADNPIAFWLMNQTTGSTLNDTSGNSNNVTLFNSPTLNQAGPSTALDKSVNFNGSTQYGKTSTVAAYSIAPSANWSVEGWFKTSSSGVDTFLHVGDTSGSAVGTLIMAYLAGGGQARALTSDNTDNFLIVNSTTAYNNNAWHHMAITSASGGALTIYVDGTNVASSSTARRTTATSNSLAYVGSQINQYYFNGNVTGVAIYNTTLSSTRVLAHYNAGK